MKEILQKATLDVELANNLIDRAVDLCQQVVSGWDRCDDFDRSMFWELYKRIADAFLKDFSWFDPELIPVLWRPRPEDYLKGIWEGYFVNEIKDLIASDARFADLIDATLANKRNYFKYTEKIDEILRNRYGISSEA